MNQYASDALGTYPRCLELQPVGSTEHISQYAIYDFLYIPRALYGEPA